MLKEGGGSWSCQGLTRVGDGQQVETPLLLRETREQKETVSREPRRPFVLRSCSRIHLTYVMICAALQALLQIQ